MLYENALLETLGRVKKELFNNETEMFYEAARRYRFKIQRFLIVEILAFAFLFKFW